MKFAEKLKIILNYPAVQENRRILKAMAYIHKCHPKTTALTMNISGDSIVFDLNLKANFRVLNIYLRPTSYYNTVLEEEKSS